MPAAYPNVPKKRDCVNHLSISPYWHSDYQEGIMHKGVLAAAGLALAAAVSLVSAPAEAMAISAPAALKGASDSARLAEPVHYWDCSRSARQPAATS